MSDSLRQEIKLHKEIFFHSDRKFKGFCLQFIATVNENSVACKFLLKLHATKEGQMAEFRREKFEEFLGTVRKYMQVRGSLSQKDLAEKTNIGVSTLSRFLSMKTADINPQIVARICAELQIPLHEMIDFVEEDFTERFVRLVKFFKAEEGRSSAVNDSEEEVVVPPASTSTSAETFDDAIVDVLGTGTAQRHASARVQIGNKTRTIPFAPDSSAKNSEPTLRDRLQSLTPRQKAYMTDFLSLDIEARDLIVDLGNDLFRYFRQRGMIN